MQKQAAAILATLHIAIANATIYKCPDGTMTDRPCTGGSAQNVDPLRSGVTLRTEFREETAYFYNPRPEDMGKGPPDGWPPNDHIPRYKFTFKYKPTVTNLCEIELVLFSVSNTNHVPFWAGLASASAAEKGNWADRYEPLKIHEDGHRAIAREYAAVLREKLSGLEPKPCDEMNAWVRSFEAQSRRQLNERQAAYDKQTHHGLTP